MSSRVRRFLRASFPGVLVVLSAFVASTVLAQGSGGPPGIDHYKVYRVLPPIPAIHDVVLRDQFMISNHIAREFGLFANPASKNSFPIYDPITHYDWWAIDRAPIGGVVVASNQFGPEQPLELIESRWLLLPSLKFPQPGQSIPLRNHYKCYAVVGRAPGVVVTIEDQFGFNQAFVDSARIYCNPVEKRLPNGLVYPIVDPEAHLVCYDIHKTPPTQPRTVVAQDQFGFWQPYLAEDVYLCVPSFKTGVVPTLPRSWGGVKAMYR